MSRSSAQNLIRSLGQARKHGHRSKQLSCLLVSLSWYSIRPSGRYHSSTLLNGFVVGNHLFLSLGDFLQDHHKYWLLEKRAGPAACKRVPIMHIWTIKSMFVHSNCFPLVLFGFYDICVITFNWSSVLLTRHMCQMLTCCITKAAEIGRGIFEIIKAWDPRG